MYPPGYVPGFGNPPPFPGHGEDVPGLRSAAQAANSCLAQREKVQTRLRRDAKDMRDQALRLLNKAEKLERAANFVDSQSSHIEEMIYDIASV